MLEKNQRKFISGVGFVSECIHLHFFLNMKLKIGLLLHNYIAEKVPQFCWGYTQTNFEQMSGGEYINIYIERDTTFAEHRSCYSPTICYIYNTLYSIFLDGDETISLNELLTDEEKEFFKENVKKTRHNFTAHINYKLNDNIFHIFGGRMMNYAIGDNANNIHYTSVISKALDILFDIKKRNKFVFVGDLNIYYPWLQWENIKNCIENKCAIYGIGFNEDTLSQFHQHFLEFDSKLQKIWKL